ncbi:MAG: sarcosine oxidase subunit delta [Pseudomonadota bacterium]
MSAEHATSSPLPAPRKDLPPMQRFTCPYCGIRDESEFHYISEPKPRPASSVDDKTWGRYLYYEHNSKGTHEELYRHVCGALVLVRRDTVTHRVLSCRPAAAAEA